MAKPLKETLNLPETRFPMRANLPAREPARIASWQASGLYSRIQEKNASGRPFILHDGPPFTNGDVHIGTALNKVLKDIIIRFNSMQGRRAPYLPGWDCHGLPIEHKVSQKLRAEGKTLEPLALRQACAEFSTQFMAVQRRQFQRLGILADWSSEYRTMDPGYEAEILRTFAAFVDSGRVYRNKKPVYWSIACQTALAEAEIEYKTHRSPSVYVEFPLISANRWGIEGPVSLVIWTTTPWTLPANLALAVHPETEYVAISEGGKARVVAAPLAERICSLLGWTEVETSPPLKGSELAGLVARHPFIDRESPVVTADYVTTESGSGCVHTAPGHGLEDYLTGLRCGLPIYCPLDDQGCYLNDGQIPSSLVGLSVAEPALAADAPRHGSPANAAVIELLQQSGTLLHLSAFTHQYPHCWRSKTPVIFRAMDQWFISLDHDGLRARTLEAIGTVEWIPEWGENRIRAAVEGRPDWCISRQRSWGVPIPAFYDSAGQPLLDGSVVRQVADQVALHGADWWFRSPLEEILAALDLPPQWGGRIAQAGRDTLDVWIDSGSSHRCVLQQREGLGWPADLYLEGSDQHRGWFQSSLWTAMVADGSPPFRKVITHGFIVDADGQKISKSGDKPMTADSFVDRFGADVIRLWVASQDFRYDIPISEEAIGHIAESYRTIRNQFRFQIGNLRDYDRARDALPVDFLLPLDRWMLHQLAELIGPVTQAYEACEFHRAYQILNRFFTVTLSATWHTLIKDRLYTLHPRSPERRSAQTVIDLCFSVLRRLLAPILLFTTEEARAFSLTDADEAEGSVHLEDWPKPEVDWLDPVNTARVEAVLALSPAVNEELETLRQAKTIGRSLDADVQIRVASGDPALEALEHLAPHLPEIFCVSRVSIEVGAEASSTAAKASRAAGHACPRCWRWVDALSPLPDGQAVCPRCEDALLAVH